MIKKLNQIRKKTANKNATEYLNAMRSLKKQDTQNREIYITEILVHKYNDLKDKDKDKAINKAINKIIKKIERQLPKLQSKDPLYARYLDLLLMLDRKDPKAPAHFHTIAADLCKYDAFYDSITKDDQLQTEAHTATRYGIPLRFHSEAERALFRNRELLSGGRFSTRLANYVTRLTRLDARVERLMREQGRYAHKKRVLKKTGAFLQGMTRFLQDNFVDHEEVGRVQSDIDGLCGFVAGMKRSLGRVATDPGMGELRLVYFTGLEESVREQARILGSERFVLAERVRERVLPEKEILPYLPAFYDLAYDYIEFPRVGEDK